MHTASTMSCTGFPLASGMPDAAGCKPPLLLDAAGCKPTPLSAIATAIATWLGALSRSHGTWAHKKREGGRAKVQGKAQWEKRWYLHRPVRCTFRLRDAAGCRSPILPDAAGCELFPVLDAARCKEKFCRMLMSSLVLQHCVLCVPHAMNVVCSDLLITRLCPLRS